MNRVLEVVSLMLNLLDSPVMLNLLDSSVMLNLCCSKMEVFKANERWPVSFYCMYVCITEFIGHLSALIRKINE